MTVRRASILASRTAPAVLHWLGKPVGQVRGDFTWVYVWGAPLRVMHWLSALCIVVLVVSGFYIGRPYFATTGEASAHFMMGRFRFAHFTAAAVLVMAGLVRAYWLFAGNRFERWSALFPVKPRDWKNMLRMARTYLTISPEQQPHFIGHNPMAQMSYTAVYAIAALMVVTGFSLYTQSAPDSLLYHAFAWVSVLLGGLQHVRLVHHAATWVFLIFLPIHVYLAIRADYIERAGVVSSILTGGRFVASDEEFEDWNLNMQTSSEWPRQQ